MMSKVKNQKSKVNKMKIFLFLLCLFALCLTKQTYENHKVVSVQITSEAQKKLIESVFNENIDVWSNEGVIVGNFKKLF